MTEAKSLPKEAKSHKKILIIAGISVAVIAIGGTIYYFVEKKRKAAALAATPCTDLNGNVVPCAATVLKQAVANIKATGGIKSTHLPTGISLNLGNLQQPNQ